MRVPQGNITELEAELGPRGVLIVTSLNRASVQRWLMAQGLPSYWVKSLRLVTLAKAYNRPGFVAWAVKAYAEGKLDKSEHPDSEPAPATPAQESTDLEQTPALPESEARKAQHECDRCHAQDATLDNDGRQLCESCRAYLDATAARMDPARTTVPPVGGANGAFVLEPTPATVPRKAPANSKAQTIADLLAQLTSEPAALDEARVIELITKHAPTPETRIVERVIVQTEHNSRSALPDDELRHEAFGDVLTAVTCNIPLMLVGPAGSGKTTCCKQIFKSMGLPFYHTGAVGSKYELSGYTDARGEYIRTTLRQAFEHGGGFLFDEYDGSDPSAVLFLQAALANGFCAFPDGPVERHPDFRAIAACNTYGRGVDRVYVGRNQQDGANLDRFAVLDFDYDERLERAVFGDNAWTARVQKVRAAIFSQKIRHIVSPRATDYGKRLLAAGMEQNKVEHMTIWKGMAAETRAKVEAAAL